MKKLAYLFVMMAVISLGFVSCDKDDDGGSATNVNPANLIGTWKCTQVPASNMGIATGDIWSFNQNGSFSVFGEGGLFYELLTLSEAAVKYEELDDEEFLSMIPSNVKYVIVCDWGGGEPNDGDVDGALLKSLTANKLVLYAPQGDVVFQKVN